MKAVKLAPEKLERLLEQIPVIKLPAGKLEECLRALASAPNQLRSEVVNNVLENVYPGFNEKRAFRALVAPALTRLHFARSEPPFFHPAPNVRIWHALGKNTGRSYLSLVLFDFAKIKLSIDENLLPPSRSLRDSARSFGPRLVDRVRGLDSMLRFYAPFRPVDRRNLKVAEIKDVKYVKKPLFNEIEKVLQRGRVTVMDEARYLVMKKLLSEGILSSSFVVDEVFKKLIQTGKLVPFRAAYAAIDSLMMDGIAFNAVVRSRGV